jgi:hypothetical protein
MPATKTKPQEPSSTGKGQTTGRGTLERTTDLSEQVLEQIKVGQENAIEAVRKFTGSVDGALPPRQDGSSGGQEVIDSALEMSERLVQVQYDFLRNVVRSTGEALGRGR